VAPGTLIGVCPVTDASASDRDHWSHRLIHTQNISSNRGEVLYGERFSHEYGHTIDYSIIEKIRNWLDSVRSGDPDRSSGRANGGDGTLLQECPECDEVYLSESRLDCSNCGTTTISPDDTE
jgi:hypothetical protein